MEEKNNATNEEIPVQDDLPDPDLKIILLGDSAVGKSKLIERYLMDEYNPRQVSNTPDRQTDSAGLRHTHRAGVDCAVAVLCCMQ
jgi:GTPase SAR1 family protein